MNLVSLWHNLDALTALLVFVAYVLVDGMYAYYTLAVTEKKPVQAATVGALMHFLIALGVLSYVKIIYMSCLSRLVPGWVRISS